MYLLFYYEFHFIIYQNYQVSIYVFECSCRAALYLFSKNKQIVKTKYL